MSSWRLKEERARISAPPFTLQALSQFFPLWLKCVGGSPCLSGRDVSKGTWLVEPHCERDVYVSQKDRESVDAM